MIKVFASFAGAFFRVQWAKWRGYEVIATAAVQDTRDVRCTVCSFFKDGECTKCGCMVMAKIMLNTEKCPINRWGRVWVRKLTSAN